MKKFLFILVLLYVGFITSAKQYVLSRHGVGILNSCGKDCQDLINKGFHIDILSMSEYGYVIIYSDKQE